MKVAEVLSENYTPVLYQRFNSILCTAGSQPWKYSSDIYAVRKGVGRVEGKRVRIKQNCAVLESRSGVYITGHPLLRVK